MTGSITVWHAHAGNLYGGIETVMLTLVRHRGTMDHRFALCFPGRLESELRALGADVRPLGPTRFSRPWSVVRARRRLAAALADAPGGVTLCHSPWALAAFGPAVRRGGGPLVLWAHGAYDARHWLERLARRSAPDLTVCNSRHTEHALREFFPGTPTDVIHPPVPAPAPVGASERLTQRARCGARPGDVVVIQVARMESGKGHITLIDALAALRDRPDWKAWIVGGAQRRIERRYLKQVRARAIAQGIADRVMFLGERTDVPVLLAAADVFCQPNTAPESFGVVFAEALYAGLPVVTSAIGGAPEIVTGACGILVPPHDGRALTQALHRLMEDAAGRSRLGAAGPARAAAVCGPDIATRRLEAALRLLLSSRHGDGIVPP